MFKRFLTASIILTFFLASAASAVAAPKSDCIWYTDDLSNVFYNDKLSRTQCESIVSLMKQLTEIGIGTKFENRSFENIKEIDFRNYDIPQDIKSDFIESGIYIDYNNKVVMVVENSEYYSVSLSLHSLSVLYAGGATSMRSDGKVTVETTSPKEMITILTNLLRRFQKMQ